MLNHNDQIMIFKGIHSKFKVAKPAPLSVMAAETEQGDSLPKELSQTDSPLEAHYRH